VQHRRTAIRHARRATEALPADRDFTLDEFEHLIARTRWIKDRFKRYELYQPLRDRTLAMVFEKASTRTRVSFEAGMNQLGGIAINLQPRTRTCRAASRSRTSRA
jgi:ornithine carbamoyltransferase